MLQLCQLDLQLAFARSSALGENVQNQRGAIQNLTIENLLQVSALGGGQFVIKDDRIDIRLATMQGKFVGFSFANKSAGAGSSQLLEALSHHLASSGSSQFGKFV